MDSERIAELSSNRTTSSVNVAVTALFFVISNVFWLIASGARQKGQSVHSFVQPFFPTLGIVYKVLNQFGPDSEIPPTLPQNAAVRYGSDDHPYNVNPEQHALIAEEGRDDASVRAIQEELSVMDMSAGEDILMGVPNSSTSNGEATSSNGRGSVPGVVGSGNFCSSDTVADDATLMSYVGYALSQEDFLKKDPAEISAYVTNGRIKSSDDCHRNYEWDKFWKPSLTKLFVHKFHESKKYMDILRKNGIDDQTEIVHSRDSYWGDRKPKRHSNLSNYWAVMFFGAYMTPELVEILKKKHRKQPEPGIDRKKKKDQRAKSKAAAAISAQAKATAAPGATAAKKRQATAAQATADADHYDDLSPAERQVVQVHQEACLAMVGTYGEVAEAATAAALREVLVGVANVTKNTQDQLRRMHSTR